MDQKNKGTHFPPAMLDIGMPEEMGPIEEITESYNEVNPMVEITSSSPIQEMNEIRSETSLTEIREDRLDSI